MGTILVTVTLNVKGSRETYMPSDTIWFESWETWKTLFAGDNKENQDKVEKKKYICIISTVKKEKKGVLTRIILTCLQALCQGTWQQAWHHTLHFAEPEYTDATPDFLSSFVSPQLLLEKHSSLLQCVLSFHLPAMKKRNMKEKKNSNKFISIKRHFLF